MNPIVTVFCPSYNHEPYLRQALESILMQKTDFPFEVLVGEDCSPDGSRAILEEYEAKYPGFFTMLYRQSNMGASNNSLDMMKRARGKYIVVLETDDYWTTPYKLQKQADFLENNPDYIAVAHDFSMINKAGHIICESCIDAAFQNKAFTLDDFLQQGFVFQSTTVMYRNFMQDGGDYSIIHGGHPIIGDVVIFTILLLRGNIYIMNDNMSAYRRVVQHEGTSAASIANDNMAQSLYEHALMLDSLEAYFQNTVRYDRMRTYDICTYFSSWLRRENGFCFMPLCYMLRQAPPEVRKEVWKFVFGYPIRKVHKIVAN